MLINCFCAAGGNRIELDDDRPRPQASRRVSGAKKCHIPRRTDSDGSRLSSTSSKSNESISRLPPCKRESDAKVEAMMMPYPHDRTPSKCLRLSHPRIYSSLVSDMKSSKGCRDWRNFAVFYTDDVDMTITADEAARKRAIEYQRNLKKLACSFESSNDTDRSVSVDMIG